MDVPVGRASGPDGTGRVDTSSVVVSDTTEIRWFGPGPPPRSVEEWFRGASGTWRLEERSDTYRVDGRHDVGVKWRHRARLELKVRMAVGSRLALAEGLAGATESWRRWSPADGLVAVDGGHLRQIDVEKRVVRRVLGPFGRSTPAVLRAWCQVEVTGITVGRTRAWSLAFAAYGPRRDHRHAIVAAWNVLTATSPAPDDLMGGLMSCSGYPMWLSRLDIDDVASTPRDGPPA